MGLGGVSPEGLASRCGACGRLFVPARHYCSRCALVPTQPAPVPTDGVLLSVTRVHRAGSRSVLAAPFYVGLVADAPMQSTFLAPVRADSDSPPRIGDHVVISTEGWDLADGEAFVGVVASVAPRPHAEDRS